MKARTIKVSKKIVSWMLVLSLAFLTGMITSAKV